MWVEDQQYLVCAQLVADGAVPYVDFYFQHLPLLEMVYAAVFSWFGVSLRAAELVTQLAVAASTWMVFDLGRRIEDRWLGAAAAAGFAWCPLLFRYHLVGREVFVVLFLLAAERLAAARKGPPGTSRLALAGVVAALAPISKLTAIGAAGTFALWSFATSDRTGPRLAVAAGMIATLGLTIGLLTLMAGAAFWRQAVVFGLVHPSFGSFTERLQHYGAVGAAWWIVAALAGIPLLVLDGRVQRWRLVIAMAVATFVFGPVLKPVVWAHNAIEILPWVSLIAAYPLLRLLRGLSRPRALIGPLLWIAATLAASWAWPQVTLRDRSVDRSLVADMAAKVRRTATGDRPIVAPSIVALAANRHNVVPYPEIHGAMMTIEARIAAEGWRAVAPMARERRRLHMSEAVDASMRRAMTPVIHSIRNGGVALVHNCTSSASWAGHVELFPALLVSSGYHPVETWPECVTWVPEAHGHGRAPSRYTDPWRR